GSLPYAQAAGGLAVQPFSPRMMILSSISKPLTNIITSGVTPLSGPTAFSNIWNAAEGTVPAGWSWSGQPGDIKIQRIQLADVFLQLSLYNLDLSHPAGYTIEGVAASVPVGGPFP